MDTDPFAPLERWLVHVMAAMEPGARRALLRDIARELRRRNQSRMARQVGPDGKAWAPRKRDRSGRVRKTVRMMEKLRQARNLAAAANADGAEIGFSGRAGTIAAIHQEGKVAPVAPGGPNVKYPARPPLGFSRDDIEMIRDRVMAALAP